MSRFFDVERRRFLGAALATFAARELVVNKPGGTATTSDSPGTACTPRRHGRRRAQPAAGSSPGVCRCGHRRRSLLNGQKTQRERFT
jgi:hypothetical protein